MRIIPSSGDWKYQIHHIDITFVYSPMLSLFGIATNASCRLCSLYCKSHEYLCSYNTNSNSGEVDGVCCLLLHVRESNFFYDIIINLCVLICSLVGESIIQWELQSLHGTPSSLTVRYEHLWCRSVLSSNYGNVELIFIVRWGEVSA